MFSIIIIVVFIYILLSNRDNWNRSTRSAFYKWSMRGLEEVKKEILESEEVEKNKHKNSVDTH